MIYEMESKYDSAKSFYGKARIQNTKTKIVLISYDTRIVKIDKVTGNVKLLCSADDLTHTTMRHLREFLKQCHEIHNLSYKDIEKPKAKLIKELMGDMSETA